MSWMREQLAAATTAEAELEVEGPMLSEQELEFFRRFGYVHRRALFSKSEMDAIYRGTDEALAARGFPRVEHVDWRGPTDGPHECSVASHPELSRLLLEDRRLWGPIEQLLGLDFVLIGVGNGEGGAVSPPTRGRGERRPGYPQATRSSESKALPHSVAHSLTRSAPAQRVAYGLSRPQRGGATAHQVDDLLD